MAEKIHTLPIELVYAGAHTGRYAGSGGINIQNLPVRGGDAEIRKAICAPEGYTLVGADSGQIEARVLAFLAQDHELIEIFATGRDPYVEMACKIYGCDYNDLLHRAKVLKEPDAVRMRNMGKEVVLACGYGMGKDKFHSRLAQQGIEIPLSEAERVVSVYRQTRYAIPRFWSEAKLGLQRMLVGDTHVYNYGPGEIRFEGASEQFGQRIPMVQLPCGFRMFYPGLCANDTGFEFDSHTGVTRLYGGKLVENIVQAIAFSILKYQGDLLVRAGLRPAFNVHDEWVCLAPEAEHEVAAVSLIMKQAMLCPPEWMEGVPLSCDVSVGHSYGDLK
jgi:DNA polymerase